MDPSEIVTEDDQFYGSGGYWMVHSQPMNCISPLCHITDVSFDPREELVWCVTSSGQLSSFYGSTLEQYTTTPVTPMRSGVSGDSVGDCNLKAVIPSPRFTERVVYMLASNAIIVYSKYCRPIGFSTVPDMQAMECVAVCRNTPCPNTPNFSSDFDRFFCGGLQPEVFELDATTGPNWGSVIRSINVGKNGAVNLKPFAFGICAADTAGQVNVIDPRAVSGVVRSFEAHSGEISDMAILQDNFTLVTCGWSSKLTGSLRIDRQVNVFDMRFGRCEAPLSTLIDPSFISTVGDSQVIIVASQTGAFQNLEFGQPNLDPSNVGNTMVGGYDRVNSFHVSSNGQCLLFGTEGGNLLLNTSNPEKCLFNRCSLPTDFASPYADSLMPTNLQDLNSVDLYQVPATGYQALTRIANKKLMRIANSAVDVVDMESTSYSLLRRSSPLPAGLLTRKRLNSFVHTLYTAFTPIRDFDDTSTFSLSSVPFLLDPPVCNTAELSEWVCTNTGSRRDGITSDWPSDLCGEPNRPMLPVDPELLARASNTGVVEKPPGMGPVWFPYDPTPPPAGELEFSSRRKKQPSHIQKMCQGIDTK